MFEGLTERFSRAFTSLRGKGRISEGDIDAICSDIREALIDADVSLGVVDEFIATIGEKSRARLIELRSSTRPAEEIFAIVNAELVSILGGASRRLSLAKTAPTVIMLAGLQGSGKTTLAAKLALFLKNAGNTPLLVAADLQRPNAVTQLSVLSESISVPIFAPEPGNGVGDPVKVAKSAIDFARSKLHNIVIVDTAGRLGIDAELMDQARRIRDAISPDEILFVVDAMIGQDAIRTAQAFQTGIDFSGIVLTKLDGDAKGGAALSIVKSTGKPILFSSTGEKVSDFDYFHPDRMASRILGMGDIQTLSEQASRAIDSTTAKKFEEKFIRGEEFTLEDFLEQLQAMKKMGSMSKLLSMLPGVNNPAIKKQLDAFDDSEIVKIQSIVQSMTPSERREPKMLNGSRRLRIAHGSGRTVTDVNALVDRFGQAQKMMKQGGIPGAPMGQMGLPQQPRFGGTKKAQPPKKKSRSGNPAKRAQEEGR